MTTGLIRVLRLRRNAPLAIGAAAILVAAVPPAVAQMSPDLAEHRAALIGSPNRTWIKEAVRVSMGGNRRCMSGETYSFSSDKKVLIATCVDHVLKTRTTSWSLVPDPPLDVNLVVDGRTFQLSFYKRSGSPKMRWRKPGQRKPDLTTDIELGLSKD